MRNDISYEYIRGLIEGEGCFSFSPNKTNATMTPSFTIRMHVREKWISIIGSDPRVTKPYKFIHKLYEAGFYENIHDFD